MACKHLRFLVFLFIASFSSAQTATKPAPSAQVPAADYSKEAVVIERYVTRAKFEADGSGTREVSAAIRIQAEAGVQQFAVLQFEYTSENESVDVDYVRVRKPNGTVIPTPAYNIQDMPADVTRTAPMYSDIHVKHIAVKGLGVGDVLEYVVRFRIIRPQVPGQFWTEYTFLRDGIIKDEELEIDVPADKYVKVGSPKNTPVIREEAGRRIYLWKSAVLVRKDKPEQAPKRDGEQPSVQLTTFHNWEEVGKWYADLQRPQLEVTPELQAKVAEITRGLTIDDDKLRAIYNYVSTRFHYVGLSFGIGRYKPHAADEVFGNEYGDCKDKHTLLATMLKAAGFDAWPALINSTRKIDPDIPSPAQFDHVITVVSRSDKLTWLDSTPEVSPFGVLLLNLRDRQALVMPTNKSAVLMTTPDALPFARSELFTAEGKLGPDGTMVGHMQETLRGDSEVLVRMGFRSLPEAQWKDLVQNISYRLGFAGDVSNVVATSPEDTSKPFQFSYDYNRKNYSDWDNRRITPPLPPFGIEVGHDADEKKPEEPVLLGAPGEVVYRAKIELPDGYKASAPKNVDLVQSYAEYHANYSLEKNVLTAVRRLVIKKVEVPLSDWDDYRSFRKAVLDDESYYINLNGGSSVPPAKGSSEVARLFREGLTAIQGRDMKAGEQSFRRITELDPTYPGAHMNLALCLMFQGQDDAALVELHKEQEVLPSDSRAYQAAAMMLIRKNRTDEALAEWQKLLKNNPNSREAALNINQILQGEGKYKDAVQVLVPVLDQSPDSSDLKVQLGLAYLKSGDTEKGKQVLQSILGEDSDYSTLNSVAYSLADANVSLDEAKTCALQAVERVEAKAADTSNADALGLPVTNELGMIWDTLGWVYFRQGDMEKAAAYLRPAWLLSQNPEVGDHLAQTYVKLGKKQLAVHTYELAWAATGGNFPNTATSKLRQEMQARFKELTGRSSPGVTSTTRQPNGQWTPMPAEELSRMRSFKIAGQPSKPAKSVNATFSVVFSRAKIEDVRFVSGDAQLSEMAEKIAATKFGVEFPPGSKAHMIRRGLLVCDGPSCDLVLLLPNAPQVTD